MSLEETQKTFSKAETSYSNYLHNSEWNLMGWEKRNRCVCCWTRAAPKERNPGENCLPSVIQNTFVGSLWCARYQPKYVGAKNGHNRTCAIGPQGLTPPPGQHSAPSCAQHATFPVLPGQHSAPSCAQHATFPVLLQHVPFLFSTHYLREIESFSPADAQCQPHIS